MKTKLLYTTTPDETRTNAKVISLSQEVIDGILFQAIVLDQTPFYPQGGGQPSDIGNLTSGTAQFRVEKVFHDKENDQILHLGTQVQGYIKEGDEVIAEIDKENRAINSKYHSAGHIIDLAIRMLDLNWTPVKGYHHKDGAYVEYKIEDNLAEDKTELLNNIQEKINEIINLGLPVIKSEDEDTNFQNGFKYSSFVEEKHNLDETKNSHIEIGDLTRDLCGGTHVKNTIELSGLELIKIKKDGDNYRVRYQISSSGKSLSKSNVNISKKGEEKMEEKQAQKVQNINISIEEIKSVEQEFIKDIDSQVDNLDSKIKLLQEKYLSKKGLLVNLFEKMKAISKDEKPEFGKQINNLKLYIINQILVLKESADETKNPVDSIDLTAPYDLNTPVEKRPKLLDNRGHKNPLSQELEKIEKIFETMGFNILDSRQLDSDYNMFTALNFPDGHPARDMWDTFHTEEGLLPSTHTSTMQHRIIKGNKPPIRYIIPGTCYRNEATDDRHEHTLMMLEGIYVDKGISLSHMITIIHSFLEEYYQTKLEVKLQPSHFPFVEPGLELCMSCPFCKKSGCSTCGHHGWIELMGCGEIHPNVLSEAGVDPEVYSGFAWGFGLDRIIMIKTGIKNIRNIRGGAIDFLRQF